MTASDIESYLQSVAITVETAMATYLPDLPPLAARLSESMRYSSFAGGKRLRPALLLATAEALGGERSPLLPAACAIEFVHTYSLIHDDLPPMDNDDFRRGKLTNHKQFDEATAILAGDGLLTLSFEVLVKTEVGPEVVLAMTRELAIAAGPQGMVGGQMADLIGERRPATLEDLRFIHDRKTGALLTAAVRIGALGARATEMQVAALTEYARAVGLAFQIVDDLLDVVGNRAEIGKSTGSDAVRGKATYPSLLGVQRSYEIVAELTNEAIGQVSNLGRDVNPARLIALAEHLGRRDR